MEKNRLDDVYGLTRRRLPLTYTERPQVDARFINELGRDNHDTVSRINDGLKERGLRTWFDSDRMVRGSSGRAARQPRNAWAVPAHDAAKATFGCSSCELLAGSVFTRVTAAWSTGHLCTRAEPPAAPRRRGILWTRCWAA